MKNTMIYLILIGLACLQMAGDVLGSSRLKGLGAALAMAPAPKVFTAHEGFETYSSRFFIEWTLDAKRQSLQLTPATYRAIRGPYNRRNAYGAALAYGPVLNASELTRPMLQSVMNYALCEPGVIASELDIPREAHDVTVRLKPIDSASRDPRWQLDYAVDCGSSS